MYDIFFFGDDHISAAEFNAERFAGERIDDSYENLETPIDFILAAAERDLSLVSLCRERAANGEWPLPSSPSDYLFWIEDELDVQRDVAEMFPEEDNTGYINALAEVAEKLRKQDILPSPAPWANSTESLS